MQTSRKNLNSLNSKPKLPSMLDFWLLRTEEAPFWCWYLVLALDWLGWVRSYAAWQSLSSWAGVTEGCPHSPFCCLCLRVNVLGKGAGRESPSVTVAIKATGALLSHEESRGRKSHEWGEKIALGYMGLFGAKLLTSASDYCKTMFRIVK